MKLESKENDCSFTVHRNLDHMDILMKDRSCEPEKPGGEVEEKDRSQVLSRTPVRLVRVGE